MRITCNNKEYELIELYDLGGISTYGVIGIFEVLYSYYENGKKYFIDEETFLSQEDDDNAPLITQELSFINYFYYEDIKDLKQITKKAIEYIQSEYEDNKLKRLLKQVKDAYSECEKSNFHKGDLDKLEDAQHDLLEWIKDNIQE